MKPYRGASVVTRELNGRSRAPRHLHIAGGFRPFSHRIPCRPKKLAGDIRVDELL
jgi:hypothetical protein